MANSADNISFKVEPEILMQKADEIMAYSKSAASRFDDLIQKINGSAGYWEGAAADAFRNKCVEYQGDMNAILKKLYAHAENLKVISLNYTNQEYSISSTAEDLPADIL